MTSAIQTLINEITNLKSLSQAYRETADRSSTFSVPDVLDIAASLISAVINRKGIDDESREKNAKESKEIDDILNRKEKIFIGKTETKINQTAEKLDDVNIRYNEHLKKYQETIEKISHFHENVVKKEKKKNEEKIEAQEKEWDKERADLMEQERKIYQNIEENTTSTLRKISQEYKERIDNVDLKIKECQTTLGNLIHDKHQQGGVRAKALEKEERRIATEHEKITHDFQDRKAQLEQEIETFNEQITTLKKMISEESYDSQDKLKRLEDAMNTEYEEKSRERQEKLEFLSKKTELLEKQYSEKLVELESEKQSLDSRLEKLEAEYAEKSEKEKSVIKSVIDQLREALENEYKPYFMDISDQIAEEEHKKGKSYDTMKQEQMKITENNEKEIQKLTTVCAREITNLTKKKEDVRHKLINLNEQKRADLIELTHERQRDVGVYMQKLDDQQSCENEQINAIMIEFDRKQKELNELHQMTVERRNKKKADQLKELKKLHETRKNQIFESIENQMKKEIDDEMNRKIAEINSKIPLTKEGIAKRAHGLKKAISKLNNKMNNLIESNLQLVTDFSSGSYDLMLKESKSVSTIGFQPMNKLQKDSTLNMSAKSFSNLPMVVPINEVDEEEEKAEEKPKDPDARSKVLEKLKDSIIDVQKRKNIVVSEAESLSKDLNRMTNNFSMKLMQIEHQYASMKGSINNTKTRLDNRKKAMEDTVKLQEKKLGVLTEEVEVKNKEAEEFEQNYAAKTEEYANAVKKEQEEALQEVKAGGKNAAAQMQEIKEDFEAKVLDLNDKLQKSKSATDQITKYMMKVREQLLEEAEVEITVANEERMKILREAHVSRMKKMDREFDVTRDMYIGYQNNAQEDFDEQSQNEKDAYDAKMNELGKEKDNLTVENSELEDKLHELLTKECEGCVQKKGIIKELLQKRSEIQSHIDNLKDNQQQLEAKMNSMFRDDTKKGTTPKVLSPRFFVPRAKTALNKGRP